MAVFVGEDWRYGGEGKRKGKVRQVEFNGDEAQDGSGDKRNKENRYRLGVIGKLKGRKKLERGLG